MTLRKIRLLAGVLGITLGVMGGVSISTVSGGTVPNGADPSGPGYWLLNASGQSYAFNAASLGSTNASCINPTPRTTTESPWSCFGLSTAPGGRGFWLGDGPTSYNGFGSPIYRGTISSMGNTGSTVSGSPLTVGPVNSLIVGIASASQGAWLAGADGGVYALGGAPFLGSMGATRLDQPVVGLAATPDGGGYWLVASDGGIFSFGDAQFYGSMGGQHLNEPIVGMASTPDGKGYWLVASDGGVFSFGDAQFHGSAGSIRLNEPMVGMAANPDGTGYWLVASDGGVFAFGDAPFLGSGVGQGSSTPFVGIASKG
ncbi:MAG: hypothetical protein ABSB09_01255 [Acidimicrobiales bacterium]|jgi:hypothetical protein